MPDIRHRVVMSAPAARVYEAIATTEGLSDWWTTDGVSGGTEVGSSLAFTFGGPEPAAVMQVTRAEPGEAVDWACVGGAEEWVGTDLTFNLRPDGDDTVVLFTHEGWREPTEFMAHCSARWAYFLLSLKQLVETGRGTPFPGDLKF